MTVSRQVLWSTRAAAFACCSLVVLATAAARPASAATVWDINGASGANTITDPTTITEDGLVINHVFGVEYLIVAGGGGGGGGYGGGGGGGGFRTNVGSPLAIVPDDFGVIVGAGGSGGGAGGPAATNGGDSSVFDIVSAGGGAGGGRNVPLAGHDGGSGGGGRRQVDTTGPGGSGNVPSVSPAQGHDGGDGVGLSYPHQAGGGGGGAGGPGTNAGSNAGDGGAGAESMITGVSVTYAGGGAGGGRGDQEASPGQPGSGGGGAVNTNGTDGLGGGGGGAHRFTTDYVDGGDGGSGIVIIRYEGNQAATGGDIDTASAPGYTVHSFLASSTFDMSSLDLNQRLATTIDGVITGTGDLTYNGPGRLTLAAANDYTGTTTISAGTLQIGNGGTSGTLGTGHVVNNGELVFYRSDTTRLEIESTISGSGSVVYQGTGNYLESLYNVAVDNSYQGGTTIDKVPVGVQHNNAFGTGPVEVLPGGQVQFRASSTLSNPMTISGTGWPEGVGELGAIRFANASVISGPVTLAGDARITAFTSGETGTISGDISGSYDLEKTGSGTIILSGNNTYSGTTISAGTLQIGNGGTSGTLGEGDVINNSELVFNRSNQIIVGNTIDGSGNLTQSGVGELIVTANNSYDGTTTISAGTLQIGNGGTSGTLGTGHVINNGELVFYRSDTTRLEVESTISGSGSVVYQGTGGYLESLYNVAVDNSYQGGTTIDKVRVGVQHNNAFGTGPVEVLPGGQLQFRAGRTLSNPMTISGTGWPESAGELGAIRFFNGSVISGPVTLAGDARITAFGSGQTGTISGDISGSYDLEKTGWGTIILSGNNSYSGTTTVSQGTLTLADGGSTLMDINPVGQEFSRFLGAGTLNVNGALHFDVSDVTEVFAEWLIIDTDSLTVNYHSDTFAVAMMIDHQSLDPFAIDNGVWTYRDSVSRTWTFTESTGVLHVVPEPGAALLLLLALVGGLLLRRRPA